MDSNWKPPSELPDLRNVDIVALDTETKDAGIRAERGSAWPWGDGYVCGVSVAYRAGDAARSHYFPLRHPDSQNFDREPFLRWLKDLVASDVRIVTQNGLYDWGWLRADAGIVMPPSERLEEIGALATLVDENRRSYSLDALCAWRGFPGKDEALLLEGCAALGLVNGHKRFRPQGHIWQLPAHYVGSYAEADAANTLALYESLRPILDEEGTYDAYRLEVDLLPMVLEMRRRGIRIDIAAAEHARDLILKKRDVALAELSEKLGAPTGMDEINSPIWKTKTFDAHKVVYPRTEKGNGSFRGGKLGWMGKHPHWLPQLIATADKYDHAGEMFLNGHILGHVINGRIHGEVNPHRSEDGSGTKSFRFSYTNPPLQQMPSRDKELGPLIRSVFLPEEGEVWAKPDVSQQEFRLLVHYALTCKLPGAQAAAERYQNDINADIHQIAADMTGLPRGDAKNVNFAKIYGAGKVKFAEMISKPANEAAAIYAQYDERFPFVSKLSARCKDDAERCGYTGLYDGARRHWNLWEAANVFAKGAGPCSREEALQRSHDSSHPWHHRQLRRHKTYTALNALIQGSAARHTKLWMRDCWREGIVPLLQLHDSLDCSVSSREQGELVARLGCEAVKLTVPMRVDLKFGRSWGDATHTWEELAGIAPPRAAEPIPARQSDANSMPEPEIIQQNGRAPPGEEIGNMQFQESPRGNGRDFYGYPHSDEERPGQKPEAEYIYRNKDRRPHQRVRKFVWEENGDRQKSFPQSWPVNRSWVNKRPAGWTPILYRLPELLAAPADSIIHIFEGEKDADRGAALGLVATTNPGGAGKWNGHFTEDLRRFSRFLIHEDNDDAGRKHAEAVAQSLRGFAKEISIARYRDLKATGDFSDFIDAGHTIDELATRTRPFDTSLPPKLAVSSAEFVAGFVPPDYLIIGWLQRRYIYSFTAATGDGKTAIALLIALSVSQGGKLGKLQCKKGAALYFAGENPTDVQGRWIATCDQFGLTPEDINNVFFVPGVFKFTEIGERIQAEMAAQELALVIVDTSAAYFETDDENDNIQALAHAKRLRELSRLAGGPTVLICCHPTKSAETLVPRGGGAFLNEVDGNITAKRDDLAVELHWVGKFRGPDFAPMDFQLRVVTHGRLVDTDGNQLRTVIARALSEEGVTEMTAQQRQDQNAVLLSIAQDPSLSTRERARRLNWLTAAGDPYHTRVVRAEKALEKDRLIAKDRGGWELKDRGRKEVERLNKEQTDGN